MIRKLYPQGKKKAFNVTYDDGVLQDVRFVELLNKYKLKGTFNLNSALMDNEFEWMHESGLTVKRLCRKDALNLYEGHEVASHTATHPFMQDLSEEEIISELSEDKRNLGTLFSREVRGFAVPFDYYSKLIEECVKVCGFDYARISEESLCFKPQRDYYNWKATVFHLDETLERLTEEFILCDEELALFQIVGHTYELDTENKWGTFEKIFSQISADRDTLPMTTIEIVDYLRAMDKAQITDEYIENKSDLSLWFSLWGRICEVTPHSCIYLREYGKKL